eukprot:5821428-Amphidinium_carterae.1
MHASKIHATQKALQKQCKYMRTSLTTPDNTKQNLNTELMTARQVAQVATMSAESACNDSTLESRHTQKYTGLRP